MKKIFSLILSLVMLLSITSGLNLTAYADVQTGKCGDNVRYSLDTSTGVLTISGTGDMTGYLDGQSPFYSDDNVKSVVIENGITSIGSNLFQECSSLSSITIPDGVTFIGNNTFYHCSALKSIVLPDGVTLIGEGAFSYCKRLVSITIPVSTKVIGFKTFFNCSSLIKVYYKGTKSQFDKIEVYSEYDSDNSRFTNAITICTDGIYTKNKTVSIDGVDYTLNDDYTASAGVDYKYVYDENIIIPSSVEYEGFTFKITNIKHEGFKDCSKLKSIIISSGITSIDWKAFYGCTSLTYVSIPNSVTSIGSEAFSNCSSLTSITIPNSVTKFGNYILGKKLDRIYYTGTKAQWEALGIDSGYNYFLCNASIILFSDGIKGNYNTVVVDGLKCELKNDGKASVEGCTDNVQDIIIPSSIEYEGFNFDITDISEQAFKNCNKLKNVKISDNVTSIGWSAFYYCENLKSVTIPNSLTTIGSYAFYGCANLTDIYYDGTQDDWNKIDIREYNEPLTNATIHCSLTPEPTPTPETEPTPSPAPSPTPTPEPTPSPIPTPTQPTTTAPTQPTTTPTTAAKAVAKPKSASIKKLKAAKKAVAVEWKKVSGVSGYEIQVATDKKFKKNKKTTTVKKQKTTKVTIKKLKAKKKYYVRIRTYKTVNGKKVYSAWSKVKTIKTK